MFQSYTFPSTASAILNDNAAAAAAAAAAVADAAAAAAAAVADAAAAAAAAVADAAAAAAALAESCITVPSRALGALCDEMQTALQHMIGSEIM
jgi:hypothetical protein